MRHTLCKYRDAPSKPASDHSLSLSGGPENNTNSRSASAPWMLIISIGSTAFFLDFDIFSTRPVMTSFPQIEQVLLSTTCSGNNHSCSGQKYVSLLTIP